MLEILIKFLRDDRGATAIEYATLLALVAISCAVALTAIGQSITSVFNLVASNLNLAGTASSGVDPQCVEVDSSCNQ